MSGLVAVGTGAELEDSNLARYGGEEMRSIREKAAQTEAAWDGCGQEPGVEVWRIEDMKVVPWPKEQYGSFYDGDSYIVLNTWKEEDSDALNYDVHFWIGENSSQDEFGVAAYKTVELDDLFGDKPVQHREVQGHESKKFLSYWSQNGGALKILLGGVESGFNHVEPEEYKPRLLQCIKKGKQTEVKQVPLEIGSLHHGDVFILDAGLKLYQFHGDECSAFEKNKAAQICSAIDSERGGQCEVVDVDDTFWEMVGGTADDVGPARAHDDPAPETSKLFRLSEKEDGSVGFDEVKTGDIKMEDLDENDVFIVDNNVEIFIWIGQGASRAEKRYAMPRAMEYISQYDRPNYLPVTRICQGGETPMFLKEME